MHSENSIPIPPIILKHNNITSKTNNNNFEFPNIKKVLWNLLLAYIVYMLCRVVYVWENWGLFSGGWDQLSKWTLLRGSLRFDTSALFYTNALYLLLALFPFTVRTHRWWNIMTRCVYGIVNSIAVIANLSDAVYSQFTGRRTTASFFSEFADDDNLGAIIFTEIGRHWYLVLTGLIFIALLWILYKSEKKETKKTNRAITCWIPLLISIPVTLIAMRGGIINTYRPLSLADAAQYVNRPSETAIVLNTPFSVIRTIGKTAFVDPKYFSDTELEQLYNPEHYPVTDTLATAVNKKNVVVIILESFGREYTGFFNEELENGKYKGYTPFIDSLLGVSLTWQNTFANGRRSIDAMPAILSSIPMFIEPFFMTGYSLNRISSLAGLLKDEGYSTAFFHGANNGSMGFENYALSAGFEHYFGRNEYKRDTRFGGDDDFDGTWAIWDEPFLQYYATKMSEMEEPFATAVFTASSHHPFVIPEQYKEIFPEEELVMHKCIRYSDNALRKFFATASQQPWFKNTIFVITNDHTNMSNHDIYMTPQGLFKGLLLIYDPSGELPREVRPGIASQIDIMPTMLGLLGYNKPFVAFGQDLMKTPADSLWTINYSGGIYQFMQGDTLIQFDGNRVSNCYDLLSDPYMKHPLPHHPTRMELKMKAIIQQYMKRMSEDRLTP